ncbi:unnamed protein product, partial [Heterotrigona itama]
IIAVVVAGRSRVGPETNVYVGIARARTCEWTTISMIDGRPCVLGSASAKDSSLDLSFSGHRARRKEEARQTAMKRVTTNGVSSSGSFK